MASNTYDYKYKVILTGDDKVGRSSLWYRYKEDTFIEKNILPGPLGLDFTQKTITINNGKICKLSIWDHDSSISNDKWLMGDTHNPNYDIKQLNVIVVGGILLIFDVSNEDSFIYLEEKLNKYFEIIQRNIYRKYVLTLLGTKCDLPFAKRDEILVFGYCKKINSKQYLLPNDAIQLCLKYLLDYNNYRWITKEKAQKLANKYNIDYFDVSAKNATGCHDVLISIATKMINLENETEKRDDDQKHKKNKKNNSCVLL